MGPQGLLRLRHRHAERDGYVDARGMGVRNKIIPLVRKSAGSDPVFVPTEDYLQLTLPKGRER